jgi:hypothetical protein
MSEIYEKDTQKYPQNMYNIYYELVGTRIQCIPQRGINVEIRIQ